ncbi:hypothetical protein CH333_10240 [candidate division WOR-3 bacterium JGI_Cruoil_03_44_89]|uniref:Uncharacterized protein n=1 Tax=candidate division WOR-3 bacterium JGI_Cruoil_03_44_89 TaxID=1973748 RepID=A0A235BND4_UNCW3|nr:MAG: hypothetical protein CH333_10240 [candidate division WOR-3 bacterium JGI_Cruoil_03_44_89]
MKRVCILIMGIGLLLRPVVCSAWNAVTHERATAYTSSVLWNSQLPTSYSRLVHKSCFKSPFYPEVGDPVTGDVELTNWGA